jgi:MYXO-CTERM domain-containing protein
VLRVAASSVRASWAIELGPALVSVRAREGRFEATDAAGVVRWSTTPVRAWDAHGVERAAEVRVTREGGAFVAVAELDARGLSTPIVLDPSWSTLPSLSKPRRGHSATTLADGSVLVAGGHDNGDAPVLLAERFDPKTNAWSAAGSTSAPHSDGTMALLPSGKVLIAAGEDDATRTSAAELWDPSTKTWSDTASISAKRTGAASIALPSGKILLVGGEDVATTISSAAEIYDETTGKWTLTASVTPKSYAKLVRLDDGRILAIGGHGSEQLAEVYDETKGTWTATGTLTGNRNGSIAARLFGKGALVAGGGQVAAANSTSELFDPASNTWSKGPPMATKRALAAGCVFGSGRVLVVGGDDGTTGAIATSAAEVYDPSTNTFVSSGAFPQPTASAACTTLLDGRVMVVSGRTSSTVVPYAYLLQDDIASDAGVTDAGAVDASSTEAGTSVAPAPISAAFTRCTKDAECSTGHCVDGVCCNSACTDRCHTCVLATSPGTCVPSPRGVDFHDECGTAASCSGTCDGAGGCTTETEGAQCAPSRCVGPTSGVGAAICEATGKACDRHAVVPFDCAPYICEPAFGACRTSCESSDECANGKVCDTPSKTCVPPQSAEDTGCTFTTDKRAEGSALFLPLLVLLGLALRRR